MTTPGQLYHLATDAHRTSEVLHRFSKTAKTGFHKRYFEKSAVDFDDQVDGFRAVVGGDDMNGDG